MGVVEVTKTGVNALSSGVSGVPSRAPSGPGLGELAPPGKLLELSGEGNTARLTTAAAIVRAAQLEGETTAWVQPEGGALFPPDLAEAGVDLADLIVIHVPRPDQKRTGGRGKKAGKEVALELARAAELLLRSGAFGLVVLDLCAHPPRKQNQNRQWQARLIGLAREHRSRVVILTQKPDHQSSAGPLINIRVSPTRERVPAPEQGARRCKFQVVPRVLKNKSGGPLSPPPAPRRGPWGLV